MTKTIHTHYDNLKVARNAPDQVIRAAYKALCKEYHHDKNLGDPDAARIMTIINSSYNVLSDPNKRKSHDLWIAKMELMESNHKGPSESPVKRPPAHPYEGAAKYYPGTSIYTNAEEIKRKRTPTFLEVILILARWASMAAFAIALLAMLSFVLYKASIKITSPFAIASQKADEADIKISQNDYEGESPSKPVYKYDRTPSSFSSPDGKVASSLGSKSFSGSQSRQTDAPPQKGVGNSASSTAQSKIYSKPNKAPNGAPWPARAGYVSGYGKYNLGGLSTVIVDNEKNTSSVFVKLYSTSGNRSYPARVVYIPARSAFKLEAVMAGKYDIRYQDLGNGGYYKAEEFSLTEKSKEGGVVYSNVTMTLYKVQGGNMNTYPIPEEDF